MWDLRWVEWSEQHIAAHRVTPSEVREVLRNRPVLVRDGRRVELEGEQRQSTIVYGVTDAGRTLAIVVSVDPNGTTAFMVTARSMTTKERREFYALTRPDEEDA